LQLNLISERKHRVPRYESDGNEMDDGSAVNEGSPYHSVHSARDREAVARIIVVAATNRIHDCDEALVRRFGVQLEVGLPSQRDRKKMLALHLEDVDNTISREEIDYLAKVTELWSGSEIENLSREAAMTPVRECIRSAALLRKRAARNEQSCGDVSGQEDSSDPADPDAEARKSLLLGFQTLRPVTVNDFMQAISLFTGKEHGSAYETLSNKKRNGGKHYDSSSDEED
jgi:SpoVK/Ycf46/Vps4 family AAA+-type ATPase